jgi:hypothetical protein
MKVKNWFEIFNESQDNILKLNETIKFERIPKPASPKNIPKNQTRSDFLEVLFRSKKKEENYKIKLNKK